MTIVGIKIMYLKILITIPNFLCPVRFIRMVPISIGATPRKITTQNAITITANNPINAITQHPHIH